MSFWIEIRCDSILPGCWSERSHGPKAGSFHDRPTVAKTLRFLEADARAAGWRKRDGGWHCPDCLKDK